jgi:cytochrome c551/c552
MTKKLLAATFAGSSLFVLSAQQAAPMPAAQQNALVQKYCAVCHTDASMNGGISFQHFDAAHADPGDAAMMAEKLRGGAMGASGLPVPGKVTEDALLAALTAEAAGSDKWTLTRASDPKTHAPMLVVGIVEQLPSAFPNSPDFFRLKLTCRADTGQGGVQLSWSPRPPPQGMVLYAAADGGAQAAYKVEGTEKMGNGAGTTGPAAIELSVAQLPARTLTIANALPSDTVVFPFADLAESVRQELSTCFPAGGTKW